MSDEEISVATRDLISRHLPSLTHVEVLLHLRQSTGGMHADDLARSLRVEPRAVSGALDDLTAGGILEREAHSGRHRWGSHSAAAADVVHELEVLYNARPVTLVRLLYDRQSAALHSLTDPLRLRDADGEE